jgi:hypothetical protein
MALHDLKALSQNYVTAVLNGLAKGEFALGSEQITTLYLLEVGDGRIQVEIASFFSARCGHFPFPDFCLPTRRFGLGGQLSLGSSKNRSEDAARGVGSFLPDKMSYPRKQ